jgi:hypothetical protein
MNITISKSVLDPRLSFPQAQPALTGKRDGNPSEEREMLAKEGELHPR